MENNFWALSLSRFVDLEKELYARVKGNIPYKNPIDNSTMMFHGLNYAEEISKLLAQSVEPKLSYIALRDAERIITEVQEVRLSALIVKAEIKQVIDRPELTRNPQVSGYYKEFKALYDSVISYLDICDKQYSYMTEILFGASQINISVNKRFFGDTDMMYNYKTSD